MRWAVCNRFPDYEVSDDGGVRRLTAGRGAVAGKILYQFVDEHGRHSVSIRQNGKTKTVRVSLLVCEAFVGPKPFPKA